MLPFYAYIRVSTPRQGTHSASLPEQRDAIATFAKRYNLVISEWFEERETASKRGRKVFERMLSGLEKKKAQGVIMHKIDRSARNLQDWAELGTLIDRGIDVYFANENLDLRSRGGRLAADLQAVVAADYSRNLREEVKKGLYGRLKQGFYPLPAPMGYIDNGSAKLKTICPQLGPLVQKTFDLYATGNYSLDALRIKVTRLGLRNKRGGILTKSGVSHLLNNPFYYGLMRIQRTGETYIGNHEPLISKALFDRAQAVLHRRTKVKTAFKRQYLFQRMLKCSACGRGLYAETHKGIIYYRCQSKTCRRTSLREDAIMWKIAREIGHMNPSDETIATFDEMFDIHISELLGERDSMEAAHQLALAQVKDRMERLTDAYIDRAIDRDTFETRKTRLNNEIIETEERLQQVQSGDTEFARRKQKFLELLKSLQILAQLENSAKQRDILKSAISNFTVSGKNVEIAWDIPFQLMVSEPAVSYGGPQRDTSGTLYRKGALDARFRFDESTACLRAVIQAVLSDDTEDRRIQHSSANASAGAVKRFGKLAATEEAWRSIVKPQ